MERHPLIDHAKFVLIFVVVLGHLIEPAIDTEPVLKVIYLSIYSFHMPAFIFLSGMLSKAVLKQSDVLKLVKALIVPFVLFSVLYEGLNFLKTGELSFYTRSLQPYWMLWFLSSLFVWKLSLPLLLKTRFPVIVSLALSLAAGYYAGSMPLGFSRTLYFLPFFIIGHKVTPATLVKMKNKFSAPGHTLMFIGILALNVLFFTQFIDMQPQWLYGSYGYATLGSTGVVAPLTRFAFLLIALLTLVSVLMLVSNQPNRLMSKGKNSLYVYLWHGVFIQLYAGTIALSVTEKLPAFLDLLVLIIISATLTFALSFDRVASHTKRLIFEPAENLVSRLLHNVERSV